MKIFFFISYLLFFSSLQSSCVLIKDNNAKVTELDSIKTVKHRNLYEEENRLTSIDPIKVDNNKKALLSSSVDTLIWTDTLQENNFKKTVIKYTKIGNNPVLKDTLQTIVFDKNNLPEKINQKRNAKIKDVYNVAIVQPFMTNLFQGEELPAQSLKAVEFYEGMKLAFDSLERENIKLNIRVFDAQKEVEDIDSIIQELDKSTWDLIIGPNAGEPLHKIAEYGKSKEIVVVSPFNNNGNITSENNYYIQLNPGVETHSRQIAGFLNSKIKLPSGLGKVNYLMVGTDEDSLKINKIQEAYKLELGDNNVSLPVLYAEQNVNISSVQKYLSSAALNVIVVASDRNETFVFSLLRELSSLYNIIDPKKGYRFLVLGASQWKYFERINFEYYNNLNLHFTDEFYINKEDFKIEQFEKSYRKVYGIAPRYYAYVGFDMTLYLGRMLKKYGTGFPDQLDNEPWQGRHTKFQIEPIYKVLKVMDGKEAKGEKVIMRYENQFLNMVEISDFEILPVFIKK
jgi:hypothetical protein